MRGEITEALAAKSKATARDLWMSCAMGIAFMLLYEGPLRAINHGGIVSIFQSLSAARAHAPVIDVDENALRFPIVCAALVCGTVVFSLIKLNINNKWLEYLAIIIMLGGGFVVDGVYGNRIIDHFISSYGYSRCPSGDHSIGTGRTEADFNHYIQAGADCPASSR